MSQWYGILRQHFASLHYSLDIFGCPFGTRDCLSALPSTSWWEEDTERHWIKCFFCSFSTQILLHAHDVTSHGLLCITWSDVWHLPEEEAGCFTASITSEKIPPTMPWPSAALSRTQIRRELSGRRRVSCSPAALRDVKGISMNNQAVQNDVTVKCNQTPAKDTHTQTHAHKCTHTCTQHKSTFHQRVPKGRQRDKQRQNLSYLMKQGNSSLTLSSGVLMLMTSSRNQYKERKVLCRWDGQKYTARGAKCLRRDSMLWTVAKVQPEDLHPVRPSNPVLSKPCAPLCFKGSQLSVADLVLRPHVVIPNGNSGCWLMMIPINGKFSWQCVCGHCWQSTSWGGELLGNILGNVTKTLLL